MPQDDIQSQDIANNLFLNGQVIELRIGNEDMLIEAESQTIPSCNGVS